MRSFLLAWVLSVFPLAAANGQDPPVAAADAPAALPLDPAVFHDTLPNGLVVYVRENREPRDRAELRLAIRAGSVLEEDDQRGLAHLVEHMAFNGTDRFAEQEIVDYLESIGMRFGPDVNAYTSFDETVYMLTVPTDSGAQFATGLDILNDWARRIAFEPAEVAKERPVVVEEWRLGRGAAMRTLDEHLPVLFHGSRYAERLPIGRKEVIEEAPIARMEAFRDAWYRPDLAAVIAVGDFAAGDVLRMIEERFGDWRVPEPAEERPTHPVPAHDETLASVATDPETTVPSVSVYHKLPVEEAATEAAYRRSIVDALRSAMVNRRLFELAQRPDPPFLGGGTGGGRFVETADVVVLGAGLHEGEIAGGIAALVTEAERAARHGFTATELDREKRSLLRRVESAYDEREKTHSAAWAGEYLGHFLRGAPAPGPEGALRLHRRILPGIGLDETDRSARRALAEGSRVVLLTAPEKEGVEVPTEEMLLAAVDRATEAEITAYRDRTPEGPLVDAEPEPGRVVDERAVDAIGVTEWILSNGVEVVLKPTDFKDDEVLVEGWSPGGTSLVPDSLVAVADFAAAVVLQGGVGDLDLVDLQKALADKDVSAFPSIGALGEGMSGRASPRDLEILFQLLWLRFTAPREDADAFSSFTERLRASLANLAANPESAFRDTLRVTLTQHHPRAPLITPGTVDLIELDEALAVYRDRFADASDFRFVIVGAFEPDSIRPLVTRWLGSLPTTGREETWRDNGIDFPAGVVERRVARGIEPKSRTALVFTGPYDWSVANDDAVRSLAEYLRIRLREELREDRGGTYGVSLGASGSRWPDEEFELRVEFGAAPERIEDLVPVVFEEIARVRRGEVDAEDLAKVGETRRREFETNLRENDFWAGRLTSLYRNGLDPASILDEPERIAALDAATITDAAQRWIDPGRYVRVTLVPESAAGTGSEPSDSDDASEEVVPGG